MSYSATEGFEFTVTGARYVEDQDDPSLVDKAVLETDDVPARDDKDSGEISVKIRIRKTVLNDDGIPVEKPGQKPEYGEIPEKIHNIVSKAQEDEVKCEATVTELDKSDESDMAGDDKIYFINTQNTDTLTQKVFSSEEEN